MLRKREVIGWSILALTILWPLALWGADREIQESKTPIARLEVQSARVDWLPQVDFESLTLTVAGPENFYIQHEFGPGETPSFSILDLQDGRLPDGVYAYELRTVPRLTADLLQRGGPPEVQLVQSGQLWVQGGSFVRNAPVQPSPSSGKPESKPPIRNFTPKDIVHADDLVVQGHACIGPVCTAVVPGDPSLTLKEDIGGLLQIKFENIGCCYPSTVDWALQANDNSGPGTPNGDFLIRNLTFNTIPFRIFGASGAPDNSLTVFANGNIGLGTLTPGADLHVFGNATDDAFASAGPNPASGPAFNFGYGGASFGRGAAFLNTRPDASATAPNPSLRFLTANVERMIVTNTGSVGIGTTSPSSKLHVNGGDIRVSGGSFIDDGVTLNAPDYVFEPNYKLMPLEELREFVAQEKHLPNVPNAREVKEDGLNLSQFQMRLLEKVEELTLYTLTQDERLTTQQEELLRLREQNALLHERLAVLEKVLPSEKPE